jgi:biopolymer transport protein ExbB
MKKLLSLLTISGMLLFGASNIMAQDPTATDSVPAAAVTEPVKAEEPAAAKTDTAATVEATMHQTLKDKFIAGGPIWMAPVLVCLILGLAICIERIIYLNMATTNTEKLINQVENALNSGGVEAAKEVCRNTRGPVASIFYQALARVQEGPDNVEKAIVGYGGVQSSRMESGLAWIALFIALAPMLGFLGTVVGMIQAFDAIAAANNISPAIVASGIQVALITTVAGLIVAIILQVFYNYILSKIDSNVISMEDASISIMDLMLKKKLFN